MTPIPRSRRTDPDAVLPTTAEVHPRLARGIVWSHLVAEMEQEQRARAERGGEVVALPRTAAPGAASVDEAA
jgi:hypothetical protein